ncbi:Response Regulator Receiver Signal Transduction Histidine Kinase [Crocosphaera chwakensis CCY0110]|uniref:Circadian input-output histidine kinase CikA n=2 Tax=Crocosphaera TaxID=263510 RepID=A3IXP8_9CHRO|nr:Response Regulator Receiver Signal Transduction Histidine Kinase [Crocosphaera chwakensis CCY0110]
MEQALKVLIIDNDQGNRLAIQRSLEPIVPSLELTEVKSRRKAISLLKRNSFNCVFLGYLLSDTTGVSLLKELQEMGIEIPLIVLTPSENRRIAQEFMKSGAWDYIVESMISPDVLLKTLKNSMRIHKAEKELNSINQQLRENNEVLKQKNEELKQQQKQIHLKNLQLQEASRRQSQFLATISHELRTPMNAIMGFSQLLLRQYPDPLSSQQTDIVQRIFNNSQNLLTLINEVLDYSKLNTDQMDLTVEEFDLSMLVQFTIKELSCLTINKDLTLNVDVNLSNPLIFNDKNFLRRILINLLSNAIKFTPTGHIEVKVWEMNSQKIAIRVEDTGIGIAQEHLKSIFSPFQQVDQTLTRQHSGTGLGLAIVHSLIKMMEGEIHVTSELGKAQFL